MTMQVKRIPKAKVRKYGYVLVTPGVNPVARLCRILKVDEREFVVRPGRTDYETKVYTDNDMIASLIKMVYQV